MTTPAETIFLLAAVVLSVTGIWEIITGTITFRTGKPYAHNRDHWHDTREYVLSDSVVVYIGFIKILWSLPLAIFGIQSLQKIEPNLLDALNTLVKTLVKTDDKVIFWVLLGIAFLLFAIPKMFAFMYGDVRELA